MLRSVPVFQEWEWFSNLLALKKYCSYRNYKWILSFFLKKGLKSWNLMVTHTHIHTLTGHQAMSRPAKKYPFRVFLLTLHDDWQTKRLVFQRLWMGRSRPHLRLSPRCPQPGWEESRLIWRWRPRSWRTDAGRRSWRWSWTSSKFATVFTHRKRWQHRQNTPDRRLHSQGQPSLIILHHQKTKKHALH